MELNPKAAPQSDGPMPAASKNSLPTTPLAEWTVPVMPTPSNVSEANLGAEMPPASGLQIKTDSPLPNSKSPIRAESTSKSPSSLSKRDGEESHGESITIKKEQEEAESNSGNVESLVRMTFDDNTSQQLNPPGDQDSQEPKRQSLFPLPADINQNILEILSSIDIQNFALSSKLSYITALPILVRCVTLPLSDNNTSLGKTLGVNVNNYTGTTIVDISNPVFWTTNYPGDLNIRKTLHGFEALKHLVIEKSSEYASDAVLGSLFLFLVEQNTLEELTIDFAFSDPIPGLKDFRDRFHQCWSTIHKDAFHPKQRKLTTLNIRITNPDLQYDGLKDTPQFWVTLLPTIQKLRLNLRDVPLPEFSTDSGRWTDYLHMISSSCIVDIEAVFDESVRRPYTEIGLHFPKVERLKVSFIGQSKIRPSAELSGLGRMNYLGSVDLPWAYDTIASSDSSHSIVGAIYSKAKERAKEVVQAKSPTESNDEKLKMQILKQTKTALTIQRLTSIKDITWRYRSEQIGGGISAKFLIHWTGTEPHITEVKVGREE